MRSFRINQITNYSFLFSSLYGRRIPADSYGNVIFSYQAQDLVGTVGSDEIFVYTNMELLILIRITPSGYVAIMTSLSRRYIYELYFHFVTRDTEVLLWM